jgi:hypothetical protein
MILFEKAKPLVARNFWRTYARRWDTPQAYLEDPRREAATRAIGRGGAGELLGRIARALSRGEDLLLSGEEKVPGLSRERLVYAATLCGSARSFQTTSQTTRIARRVFDEAIRDSRIEGQLTRVRLIGARYSGAAYGALLEVGDRFCVPSKPRCQPCPLREMCATGQKRTRELHPMLFSGRD